MLLIFVGFFLLLFPNYSNIKKIGATFAIIGFFLITLKPSEKATNNLNDHSIMSIMIFWTIIVYFIMIVTNSPVDILFFFVLIGLLIVYEFKSKVVFILLKNRIHFAIIVFLMIILMILIKEIIKGPGI